MPKAVCTPAFLVVFSESMDALAVAQTVANLWKAATVVIGQVEALAGRLKLCM